MTSIVDIDALVPDDFVLRVDGTEYPVPGDLPVEVVLRLFKANQALAELQGSGDNDAVMDGLEAIIGIIHDVLRIRTPDAEPALGPRQMMQIVGVLLTRFNGGDEEADAAPPTRTTRRTTGPSKRPSQRGASSSR